MSLLTQTSSPILPEINPMELSSEIKNNPLLLPSQEIIQKSEFLTPLADSTIQQYLKLWQDIRQPVYIQ